MEPQIFTLHNQILEATLPEAAFPFLVDGKKHTIALVGGGGKTTLMYFFGDTYEKQNVPTLITTTTHIRMPEDGSYVTTMAAAYRRWDAQRYAVVGMPDQAGKITNILVKVGDMVRLGDTIAYVNPLRAGVVYNDSPVKAPISGRVTSLPVTVGSTVSQSSLVAKVARTDELEIRINIAERFVSRISNGQKATVTFDAYPGVVFGAKIFEVSPVLDTATRTMGVKLRLNPPDSRVKVGMYGRVKLVTESVKNAIVLPVSALVARDGKDYVFVVTTPKSGENAAAVSIRQVTKGILVDNQVEITKGLEADEEVVIKGQTLLNDGAKVNIVSSK